MEKHVYTSPEQEPFLEPVQLALSHGQPSLSASVSMIWTRRSSPVRYTICFCLAIIYTALIILLTHFLLPQPLPLSPNNALTNPPLRYIPTLSVPAGSSPYAGGPSNPGVDAAWHELMSRISMRVSNAELQRNGNHRESVSLPEDAEGGGGEGGKLVWLGVWHQLHCLKMIRQMNYREFYFPNQTEAQTLDMEVHINHCIENLRQSLICHPDTSFTTFVWTHTDPKPVLDVRRFERQCADWEYFVSGLENRVVSYEEVDRLRNPHIFNEGEE